MVNCNGFGVKQKNMLFARLFLKFMEVNKRNSFSSYEIIAISSQITAIMGVKNIRSVQHIINILNYHGIKNVLNKHSKSVRHNLWFVKPLCPTSFKLSVEV